MYISPIQNYYSINQQVKNRKDISSKVNFGALTVSSKAVGQLQLGTAQKISNLLYAYEDIISKLACKSEEGIKFIMENFPVTIRDGVIFHNCGENKNSIAINAGGGEGVQKLVHVVRRKGNTSWSDRIIEDAFMIENNSRLLGDFKKNYMNTFPKERKYLTQEEILQTDADLKIQKLVEDLDPVMLKLRIFLLQNADKYVKIPDGKLPYSIIEEIKKTERLIDESRIESKKIPRLQLYKLLEEQHKEYVPLKANSTYSFKNLGDENVTIAFAPIESGIHENLKRLVVYNQDGSLKKVFILQNNKLVKNTSPTSATYLADKFEFYNEKEILSDEVSGEFLKYLKLYQKSVSKLQAILAQRVKSIEAKTIEGVFDAKVTNNLVEANNIFEDFRAIYSKTSSKDKKVIKEELAKLNVKFIPNGIVFPSKESFKEIYFQPVNSHYHTGLLKLAIIDNGTEMMDYFLIHNNEKIVKNFYPNSPNIIPQKIKYLEEEQMPDLDRLSKDLIDLLNEIKDNTAKFAEKACQERMKLAKEVRLDYLKVANTKRRVYAEEKQKVKDKLKEEKRIKKENFEKYTTEQKELIKTCKKQFQDALSNLDNGLEEFNKAMQEIQQKVTEFYIQNKKVV